VQKRTILLIGVTTAIVTTVLILFGVESLGSQIPGVNELRITKTGEISYKIMFEFCSLKNNLDAIGVSVKSEMEFVPIPIDFNMGLGQCHEYGTNIHTSDTSTLSFSLFTVKDLENIIEPLEQQMYDFNNSVVSTQQELLKIQKTEPENLEKIKQIKDKLNSYQEILDSTKNSIKAIRGMQ